MRTKSCNYHAQATIELLRARFESLSSNLPPPSVAGFMQLLEFSSHHGISPALAKGLRSLAPDLPWRTLTTFLDVIEQNNAARNETLYRIALATANTLEKNAVPMIFLKGAAVLLESRSNAHWRTIMDLDTLVSPE